MLVARRIGATGISDLISENVAKYKDEVAYQKVLKQEKHEKELLEDLAENWASVTENWDDIKDTYC